MGWFFINIVLPVAVPAAFMLLARFANLPPEVADRTSLRTLVQDGQLGWVALSFSASCGYDVFAHLLRASGALLPPAWVGMVLVASVVFIAASGFLAALGALFPAERSWPAMPGSAPWRRRHALFAATAVCAVFCATLRCVVHFYLPASDGGG
jgi:hypothetical protein